MWLLIFCSLFFLEVVWEGVMFEVCLETYWIVPNTVFEVVWEVVR